MKLCIGVCTVVSCCLLPLTALADIYAYTGADGVIHLTNVPQGNKRYRLVMKTPKIPVAVARADYNPIAKAKLQPIVQASAQQYGVSPALLNAVITVESGFNAGAVSPKGAMGLMQLMPATALRFGANDPFNPAENIRAGTAYLAELLHRFNGDLHLALAAYNAGSQAVIQAGYHIPPFPETQNYVPRVMAYFHKYQGGADLSAPSPIGTESSWVKPIIQISSP
ncbi:MAG: lytic transglycosylase domain-containing protein [Acidithiobacillus sp.]|nr:lytic transglycosylase domain-containing protein [Acidithiobacillus sp.]